MGGANALCVEPLQMRLTVLLLLAGREMFEMEDMLKSGTAV